jgi:hypothetical protein
MNIKTKQRNRLGPEDSIQIALTSKCPNFDVIVSPKPEVKQVFKEILLFHNEDINLFYRIYFILFIIYILYIIIFPVYIDSLNLLNLNNL